MLSPKQIGTICFAIFSILISAPLFATDIPSSASTADCKHTPLQVYSGTSNLEAGWTANEISLYWYNNNTLMEVDNASSNCTYDSTLTPPSTIPTRTGYTFKGWRVRPTYDFSTIPTSSHGDERWGKDQNEDSTYTCWYRSGVGNISSSGNIPCDSRFDDLMQKEWKVSFGTSYVYGMAKCSETQGGVLNNISNVVGRYCWCKATGYKPSDENTIYSPSEVLPWYFRYELADATYCAFRCAYNCMTGFGNSLQTRNKMLNPIQ